VRNPRAESVRWIISPLEDLVWFHGSVIAGIALLALFLGIARHGDPGGHAVVLTVFLWGALLDGTHVWATYARSYLAPDDPSHAVLPGAWSAALLGIGPIVALLGAAAGSPGLFAVFLLSAYLWAYWHLVRQHYGFVMLYRGRAGETDPRTARIDGLTLWAGCLYPFVLFSLGDGYAQSGLPPWIPTAWIGLARSAVQGAFALTAVSLVAITLHRGRGRSPLGPKHLLMAIVVGFHLLVFALLQDLLAILATLTIFHNLQYHRIVWLYERGRGRTPSAGMARYLVFGVALGAVWYGVRVLGVAAVHSDLTRNLLVGLGWGIAFHHYLVDGRIWHVRRSPTVSAALEVGAAA